MQLFPLTRANFKARMRKLSCEWLVACALESSRSHAACQSLIFKSICIRIWKKTYILKIDKLYTAISHPFIHWSITVNLAWTCDRRGLLLCVCNEPMQSWRSLVTHSCLFNIMSAEGKLGLLALRSRAGVEGQKYMAKMTLRLWNHCRMADTAVDIVFCGRSLLNQIIP